MALMHLEAPFWVRQRDSTITINYGLMSLPQAAVVIMPFGIFKSLNLMHR